MDKFRILLRVREFTALLSCITCLLVIFLYFIKRKILNMKFINTIIFQLCISCLLLSISNFPYEDIFNSIGILLKFQGIICATGYLCSFLFITSITLSEFYSFANEKKSEKKNSYFNLIATFIPWINGIIYSIILWFYGWKNNQPEPDIIKMCRIDSQVIKIVNFAIFLILFLINFIYILILIVKIALKLRNIKNSYLFTLIKYIIAQIIVFSPLIVDGIFYMHEKIWNKSNSDPFWWICLRGIIESLSGFILSFLYSYNNDYKTQFKNVICCKKETNINEAVQSCNNNENELMFDDFYDEIV